jgi:hypothetical protein
VGDTEQPHALTLSPGFLQEAGEIPAPTTRQEDPQMLFYQPKSTTWKQLLSSSNNQGMVMMTGVDINTFHWLVALFKPIHNKYSPSVSAYGHIQK